MARIKQYRWLLMAVFLAGFIALALLLEPLMPLDTGFSVLAAGWRTPFLTWVMTLFTNLASVPALLLISLALILIIRQNRYRVPLFANLGISVILNLGLKDVFTRARPAAVMPLVVEKGYSFPSGHSMAAAAFYGFLIYLLWHSQRPKGAKRTGTALLLALILLAGFSRVYLGVHYLSDVLAGFLVSGAYLLVFISFVSAYFQEDLSLGLKAERVAVPSLLRSFAHAFDGIIGGLKAERNMVVHFGIMVLVIVLAFLLRCSPLEWGILLILFALVIGAELINTAIEAAVDLSVDSPHPLARTAKDAAAGAVLVCALSAAIVGLIILGPKVLRLVRSVL